MKRLLSLIIIFGMILGILCSCKDGQNDKDIGTIEFNEDYYDYSIKDIDLPDDPQKINDVLMAQTVGDSLYILETVSEENSVSVNEVKLYKVDGDGRITNQITIGTDNVLEDMRPVIYNGSLLLSSYKGVLSFYNIESGEAIDHHELSSENLSYVLPVNNGLVVSDCDTVTLYDKDFNAQGSVTDSFKFGSGNCEFWEDGGDIFASFIFDNEIYRVDFDNGELIKLYDTSNLPLSFENTYGKYIVGNSLIYKIDVFSNHMTQMANLGSLNVRPPKGSCAKKWFICDDSQIIVAYIYRGGKSEIQILNKSDNYVPSGKTTITIGTIDHVSDDLNNAVYEFNSTHPEYQIEIVDYYANGVYCVDDTTGNYSNAEQRAMLDLISYFNAGNMPDMLYSESFDYEYLGRIGILEDLLPIMNSDPYFNPGDISDPVWNALTGRGHCYAMMSSYNLQGYWGLTSYFDDNDVSLESLLQISENTGIRPVIHEVSRTLAYDAIGRGRYDIVDKMSNGHFMSLQDMNSVISYAIKYGVAEWGDESTLEDYDTPLTSKLFLTTWWNMSLDNMELGVSYTYIGFPSVSGSYHTATPRLALSICSDSDHRDICWEFIKSTLTEEYQRKYYMDSDDLQYNYPVNKTVAEELLEQKITDDIRREDLRRAMNSIDTVYYRETGLWIIVMDEISSYYTQGRSVDDITESMLSRIDLYVKENYN
ncbi:ABC-type glycerol-3-phosphate transport system, substrate-binding protein [Ruminococcaceae bacterium YRB3002]|nr:ABC-type glycerol-3-phosphate transport system, substrate-binding protein [Ruminococcaceae bacterium YRB3002]